MSRYVDEENSALFPFGWGLSYTRFSYSKPTVSRDSVPLKEVLASSHAPVVKVGVDVKNTGSVAGTEVVQMYIRNTGASVEQPVRELKGFARVQLAPGESKHVEFPLGFDELNFYNVEDPAHRGTDHVQDLGGRKLPGYRGDQPEDRRVTERSLCLDCCFGSSRLQHFFSD